MTNYSLDERERNESQKQREQRAHKPCQQWDAQTQSYVFVDGVYEDEEVTNPKHYDKVGFGIQPLEYITANELDFLEGNIIKYVSRYPHKGGVNDLLKARTYLEKLIKREVEKT